MHERLIRQFQQLGLDSENPPQAEAWQHLLALISETYEDAEVRGGYDLLASALFRIAEVTSTAIDMPAFYRAIHEIIGQLMYAGNFYIALYDPATGTYSFPYLVDDYESAPDSEEVSRGLTAHVVRTGEPLLVPEDRFHKMVAQGVVESIGRPAVDWLGVPLKRGSFTFGALVVQSYRDDIRYSRKDLELLTFVSQHIATAIERKQAQEALRESREQYRMIIENIEEIVYILDNTSRGEVPTVRYVSPQVETLLGYSVDEIYSTPGFYLSNVHPEDRLLVRDFYQDVIAAKRSASCEYRRKDKRTGVYRWIEDIAVPHMDESRRVVSLFGVARDVTERKQSEAEREALLAAEQKQRLRAEALAGMTLALTSRLSDEGVLDEILRQALKQMPCRAADISLLEGDALHLVHWQGAPDYSDDPIPVGLHQPLTEFPVDAEAVRSKKAVIIEDCRKDERWKLLPETSWIRSTLMLPIVQSGQVLGILRFNSGVPGRFDDEDIERLQPLANGAAIALENMRLLAVERRRNAEMEILRQASLQVSSSLELGPVLRTIQQYAMKLAADVLNTHIFLYDGRRLHFGGALWGGEDKPEPYSEPRENGLTYTVARGRRRIVVPDVNEDRDFYIDWKWGGAIVSLPLRWGDEVLGVMNVAYEKPHTFGEDDLRALELLADQAAVAIHNSRLFEAERKARERAETLQAATQALSASLDLRTVLTLILGELRHTVPYDSASVQQLEDDSLIIIGGDGFPNPDEIIGLSFDRESQNCPNFEVVRSRTPMILEDAPQQFELFLQEPHAQAGIRSWMGVPLLFGDRMIGMLSLDKRESGFYSMEDAELVQAFAAQAAIAIENARLYETAVQRARQLGAVSELSKALRSVDTIEDLLPVALENVVDLVDGSNGAIALIEADTGALEYRQWYPENPELVGLRYKLGEGLVGRVAATGEVLISDEVDTDPNIVMYGREAEYLVGLRSAISLPLRTEVETIGVLQVGSNRKNAFTEDSVNVLRALAEVVSVALTRMGFRETLEQTVAERTADLEKAHRLALMEAANVAKLNVELERRRLELETINQQLQEASLARLRFLANMSHELRTPLNGILGITETLLGGVYGELSEKQNARLRNVLESGRHLLQLVNDLLDLARIETDHLEIVHHRIEVEALCKAAVRMVQPIIEARGLQICVELDEAGGSIEGDERRLVQVLVNLLDNAAKFTPRGGQIGLSVGSDQVGVTFEVWDTGIGIQTDRLADLFEPFVQVDDDLDRRYQGTGLGLALVKHLVELHGGKVTVESGIGDGSRFRVWIPRYQQGPDSESYRVRPGAN